MILITNIEYIETDKDEHEIMRYSEETTLGYPHKQMMNNIHEPVPAQTVLEVVRGVRLRRPDGADIRVGLSQQAGEVLGMKYEAWKELKSRADYWRGRAAGLQNEVDAARKANWKVRLKWLFKGYSDAGQGSD